MSWEPKVLTEFEVGQAMAAIEAVSRADKAMTHVGSRSVSDANSDTQTIERDLRRCLEVMQDATGRVHVWLRPAGDRLQFGFYGPTWALWALEFLDRDDLTPQDRHWISGLLFGYRPTEIQRFLDANCAAGAYPSSSPSASRRSGNTGTGLLREILPDSRR